MFRRFANRMEAGQQLAKALSGFSAKEDALVLALPRGGVPVAHEITMDLGLPLDVLLVRKIGVPGHEELAMGAIAEDDVCVLNQEVINRLGIQQSAIDAVINKEQGELSRRSMLYRGNRPMPKIKDSTIIVVDDGLATGATMKAAIKALRKIGAAHIVVAVPVGAQSTCEVLEELVDELICLFMSKPFFGIGYWYKEFSQTSDSEVQKLLSDMRYQMTAKNIVL